MRTHTIITILFISLFTATPSVLAQTTENTPATTPDQLTVKAVEVKGNKSIGSATILSRIKTRVGQEYRQSVISDDLKRLYNTGYFSDVSVDRENYAGGLKVVFFVVEKAIVEKITFSKIRYYKTSFLLRKMKTKKGKFLDNKALNDDIRMIKELYEKKGLTQVEVSVEKDYDELNNKMSLHVIIKEGERVRVKRVLIDGNMNYRDKRILRLIKTRPAWLFHKGYLKEDVLDEDMERIRAFYEHEGYIDAKVDYVIEKISGGLVNIRIRIKEGKRYYVEAITIEGNKVISDAEILGIMKEIKVGKVFSRKQLNIDLSNIRTLYFDRGYIFAQVEDSSSLNAETGKVEIRLEIKEGSLAYINKIKIQGNDRTRDAVIRRELRLYPGDRFDGAKLRRSKERLRNLGYFEDIGYDIEDTDLPDKKNLVVDVKEAKTGAFSFGGGYSTVDQLIGFVEIEQKNFDFTNWPTFTGGGQDLSIRAETGTTRNNTMLSFTEPYIFDYPVSGGFDAYITEKDKDSDIGYAYDEKRAGGNIRFGKQFTEYVTGRVAYKREDIKIGNFDDDVSADLLAEEGKNTVSSLSFTLARDARDSVFNPTKGLYTSGTADVAGGVLGGDKDFVRFSTNTSYNIPLKFDSVLEFRLRTGVVNAYGDSEKVPIFERFFAGGAKSIRGYEERKVGPLDSSTNDPIGGESLLVGNVEFTVPIIEFIKVAAFFDSGNVWSKLEDFGTGNFKSGAGMGLRIKTPIGPVNLDYGYPLNDEPGEEDRTGKFYFSVSRGF